MTIRLFYQNEEGPKIRGTLACNIVVGTLFSIAALGSVGAVGRAELYATLALIPFALAGMALSSRLTGIVDGGRMRPLLLGISALAACFLLVRELVL